jgi:hypothetical protein
MIEIDQDSKHKYCVSIRIYISKDGEYRNTIGFRNESQVVLFVDNFRYGKPELTEMLLDDGFILAHRGHEQLGEMFEYIIKHNYKHFYIVEQHEK